MKRITAILLSVMMLICMFGTTVSAAEGNVPGKLTVTKDLVMDNNVTEYPEFEFEFPVEPINTQTELDAIFYDPNEVYATRGQDKLEFKSLVILDNAENNIKVPELNDVIIKFDNSEIEITDSERTDVRIKRQTVNLTTKNDATLDINDFPTTGLYLYKVTETHLKDGDWTKPTNVTKDELVKQSEEEFIIVIPVTNKEGSTQKEIDPTGAIVLHKVVAENNSVSYEKIENAIFENVYQREPGIPNENPDDPTELTIKKNVKGNYGDKTKDFTFKITLGYNATEDQATVTTYEATKYKADGTTEKVTLTVGTASEFTLKHDEKLVFDDLPVGSTYYITEEDNAGYNTTADFIVNGAITEDVLEETFENSTYVKTVGESTNKVDVTNDADLVLTGIVTDNFSFVLLITVAAAGMVAYVVMKRSFRTN